MTSDKTYDVEARLDAVISSLTIPILTTTAQTISTQNTSYANVNPSSGPGLNVTLGVGTYVVDIWLTYVESATASQQPRFQFTFGGTFTQAQTVGIWQSNNATTSFGGWSSSGLGPIAGPNYTTSTQFLHIRLKIVTSAGGTLQLQANTSLAADTYAIQPSADMSVQWWGTGLA